MHNVSAVAWILLLVALGAAAYLILNVGILLAEYMFPAMGFLTEMPNEYYTFLTSSSINATWYPPNSTHINNLNAVINGTGVYGFIFNNSYAPADNSYYGGYNWCNMPHVNKEKYSQPSTEYALEYVEVIHRHHKRTPYAANTFPRESYTWDCEDEGLFYYGKPLNPSGNNSAAAYWSVYTTTSNPFAPEGFNGTCQFPQITRGGLDDSWQHGRDLWEVYHDLLGFLPDEPRDEVTYRVTNNVITSQVAGMVVAAMYNAVTELPLGIQPASIDSLEPVYICNASTALYSTYGVGSTNPNWTAHLTASQPLFTLLDSISGVSPNDPGFHQSWDHYFDNLSSRLCHGKPLPCKIGNSSDCVTSSTADAVFRLGLYEYSYLYRSAPQSFAANVPSYGVWMAELAQNIRDRISGAKPIIYRHNVAHDGSLARLLSMLQVDEMVWPGLGSEIVFEVWVSEDERFLRVFWGGVILRSSEPSLGVIDMLPLANFLAYVDELVGVGASKIPGLCGM